MSSKLPLKSSHPEQRTSHSPKVSPFIQQTRDKDKIMVIDIMIKAKGNPGTFDKMKRGEEENKPPKRIITQRHLVASHSGYQPTVI